MRQRLTRSEYDQGYECQRHGFTPIGVVETSITIKSAPNRYQLKANAKR